MNLFQRHPDAHITSHHTAAHRQCDVRRGPPPVLSSRGRCSFSASQPLSLSASQPLSFSASQPLSLSASQPLSLSASQPLSFSASQPLSLSASQPLSRLKRRRGIVRLQAARVIIL
ncbi:hypothetical protein EYF80_060393 [Liparis tanakae]|uniref:Uncharacterized protein n=1 Tax=Liparis tanakae TaxID=230148 RepID=A0A4Z2EKP4_9TELE|nr:hypothetical protein EYF80_060393 [Liparis tanakae]